MESYKNLKFTITLFFFCFFFSLVMICHDDIKEFNQKKLFMETSSYLWILGHTTTLNESNLVIRITIRRK